MKKVIPSNCVLIPTKAVCVHKGIIFDVYNWEQELFDGSNVTYEMLKRPDTVNVIGIVEDKILLLDNTQPVSGTKKCFPGGQIDTTDKTAEDAAKRELLEETGYSFKNWRLIQVTQPYLKLEWFINYFVAWDMLEISKPLNDPGEKTSVNLVGLTDLKKMIETREGYLGEVGFIFDQINQIEELIKLPLYSGQEIDR